MSIAHYDRMADDGSIALYVGFDIGDQPVRDSDDVHVVELPVAYVASVVHKGALDTVVSTYDALARWIHESGHHLAGPSRELYLEWHDDDPTGNVVELQLLIAD